VHNHPSGDPTPSRDDIEMTREVQHAALVLSIVLHDHIIVGHGKWLEFSPRRFVELTPFSSLPPYGGGPGWGVATTP
jgi:hypothetical protein